MIRWIQNCPCVHNCSDNRVEGRALINWNDYTNFRDHHGIASMTEGRVYWIYPFVIISNIYIYIYVSVCVCVCARTRVCVCVYIYTHIYIYIYMRVWVCDLKLPPWKVLSLSHRSIYAMHLNYKKVLPLKHLFTLQTITFHLYLYISSIQSNFK